MIITEKEKELFSLSESDIKEITRRVANGATKAQALIAMGKAAKHIKVNCNKAEASTGTKKPREVKVDPTKDWLLNFIRIPLEGCENVESVSIEGTKALHLEINGESYTLALTKHKKKD